MSNFVSKKDSKFTTNNGFGADDEKEVRHIHGEGGDEVVDSEVSRPFLERGLHIQCRADNLVEVMEAMADTVLREDWEHFEALRYQLNVLEPPRDVLDEFGRKEMRDIYVRHLSSDKINTLREKLASIGVSEKALDAGFSDSAYDRNRRGIREFLSNRSVSGKRWLFTISKKSKPTGFRELVFM